MEPKVWTAGEADQLNAIVVVVVHRVTVSSPDLNKGVGVLAQPARIGLVRNDVGGRDRCSGGNGQEQKQGD